MPGDLESSILHRDEKSAGGPRKTAENVGPVRYVRCASFKSLSYLYFRGLKIVRATTPTFQYNIYFLFLRGLQMSFELV